VLLPHSQMSLKTTKNFSISQSCFNPVDYAHCSITDKVEQPLVEHPDQSLRLGLGLKELREQFGITDRPLEIITDPPKARKYFEYLHSEYEYLLLKEFFYRVDFSDFLLRTMIDLPQRITFARLLSPMNVYRLILNANSALEVSKIFLNMLLACRLLPPTAQKEIYDNLEPLFTAATRIGRVYGQETLLESMESILTALFEFDLLPLSYSSSAQTKENHFFAFIETLWDLLPTIFHCFSFWDIDTSKWIFYAEKIYESVRKPKYDGETWETIVRRICKRREWMQSFTYIYIHQKPWTPGESIVSQEIYYFLNTLRGYFEPLVEVFEDSIDRRRETQVLLNELVLKNMPFYYFPGALLNALRRIRKVSIFEEKNLLLAGYKKVIANPEFTFNDDFCEDIVNGLSEDQESWIAVLSGYFACRNPPRSRFAYDSFYGPVRRLFERIELDETNKDYYASLAKAYSELVKMRNSATSEEWRLLLRSEYFRVHPDIFIDLIKETSPASLPEESRSDLVIYLLSAAPLQPKTVLALIRLMETSKSSLKLGRLITEHLETYAENQLPNLPSCTWDLLAIVARNSQSLDVHEKLLVHLLRVLQLYETSKIDLNAGTMYEVFSFIMERNLCRSDSYVLSIEAQIGKIFKETTPNDFDSFYFGFMLNKINPSNKNLNSKKASYRMRPALLIHRHRTTPASINVNDFSEALQELLGIFLYNTGDNARISLMIIKFIQEFHSESYFNVIRSSQFDSRIHEHRFEAFYPRLKLLEAKKYLNDNQPISDPVKKYLSNCDYCTQGNSKLLDDQSIERYLFLRNEQQYIAEEAAKIFSRTTDAYSVKFFARIYFLILNHEAVTETYAAPVFTQIARL
jgi:hypothetical protein